MQIYRNEGDNMQVKQWISQEEVEKRIAVLAEKINEDMGMTPLHLVGILKGSVMFMSQLMKHLQMPVTIDFMKVSSYGDGTESSGNISIDLDLSEDISGKCVLIVEDILDTGRTLFKLRDILNKRGAESFQICVLLDKTSRRVCEINADYVGFEIEDKFVVGYGMDYAQEYRNLPYIGIME